MYALLRLDRRLRRLLFSILATAAAAAFTPLAAQTDVIRGRVTNQEGLPLPGVRVTATSIPGSVTREARTNAQGQFQIAFPGAQGDYMMGYALIGYVYRQFEIKRLADEEVLVADARLSIVQLDTVIIAESNQQRINRNQAQTPDIGGTERSIAPGNIPPELLGDIAAMAASLPGVLLVPGIDGAADGFSVMGLGADQNSVTLNGMSLGANGLPRDANISSSLTTAPYDVSRGGFSGGNFNIRSGSGSNFLTRGLSLNVQAPQAQWTDRAGRALGSEYTNLSFSGLQSGPIQYNRSFYSISWQADRNSRDNQTLLSTDPLGLRTAGVAQDSVQRFLGILNSRGIPVAAGALHPQRLQDRGSLFATVDFQPPNSSSGHSYHLAFNGNWGRSSPVAFGPAATQLASSMGDRTNWGGGLQARHSGYLGLTLSESSIGVNVSRDEGNAYLDLPGGRVRVNSAFDDGTVVRDLTFGGNQGLSNRSESMTGTMQNTLSWFDDANKHRIKLTTELQYGTSTQDLSQNLLGTFTFNSLADLEAGRPASYSRTLAARERSTGQVTASVSLGDTWRRTTDFQLQYGLRIDASRFTGRPAFNPAVEQAFGRRNDAIPTPVSISPRVGFSWTVGRNNEIDAYFGAARVPRAVVRGGIGLFTNGSSVGQAGAVLDNTGLPGGNQQIFCVGPAVPTPEWAAYSGNTGMVPSSCADGSSGTVFSNPSPNVTLFGRDYAPQRTVRSNLSWNGGILDARFTLSAEGSYSVNLNQQRQLDLNFAPTVRFTLADDGRPVFVQPTSIVPATGSIASRDARRSTSFSRVTELRSDLQSRTAQLSFRLSPITRGFTTFGWNAAYTYSHITEQVSGFTSTAGDPLTVTWARSGQGPHQISYGLRYSILQAVHINWNGSFRSGSAYTPIVVGDINGDGYSNDRAFIHSPAGTADPALAEGMRQLLANTSEAGRECLERQLGAIAKRNSCRSPWTSNASLSISLDRAKFRMPYRANVSFSLQNPLGAADLAINGSDRLRGWGSGSGADAALLYVRGFDPAAQRYRYEVNQRFGATRPQLMTMRQPVVLTAMFRYDLGAMREEQQIRNTLRLGRSVPGARQTEQAIRSQALASVMNVMVQILRQQDSLRLTTLQADSLVRMNRQFMYRSDSIWTPVARHLAALPERYDAEDAWDRFLQARRAQIDMLMEITPSVRGLLTAEQLRKLPSYLTNYLDTRYLVMLRSGTGLYSGGGGGGPMFFGSYMSMMSFDVVRMP